MTETDYRTQLVELGVSLFARGYSVGVAGNMSLRLPGGAILATPTNSCLGRLSARDLSVTNEKGEHVGGRAPTSELPLHLAIYGARPQCNAIVHLHSSYATALSALADIDADNAITPFTPYYVMTIGKLPLVPYHRPGTPELGVAAAKIAVTAGAFLLANHGSVACGTSLPDAVNKAEELEETAKLYFLLRSAGGSVRYLTEQEINDLVRYASHRRAAT